MTKQALVFVLGCLMALPVVGSKRNPQPGPPQVEVRKTKEVIQVDGFLDEGQWLNTPMATDFWQNFPADSLKTNYQTEVYMVYTDEALYVGAKCYSSGRDYIVPSLKRDYRAGGSDNITFLFDSFNDGANAFVFGINPYGVRREALITEGGDDYDQFQTAWDNKWEGAAQIHDDHWSLELRIPFSTLRYNEGSKKWRFNTYRFDTQVNERSSWVRIPRNQSLINLAFMGDMHWEEPLKKSGPNISLIPYAAGSYSKDYEAENPANDLDFNLGGDAKIAITPGLNLDLTFNPDFSQVEVDQQVTNLSRFEVFFPERRQFFIENSDLFGGFGSGRINPFFSRRMGIVEDTSTGQNIANPILAGARLNGKLSDDVRIGLLNMTTQEDRENGLPTFNYTVAAAQYKVGARSNIGAIFVNKQALNPEPSNLFDRYNRIMGIDYNLLTADNRWNGKVFFHKAFVQGKLSDSWAHGVDLEYRVHKFYAQWTHSYVGENFDAQVGFVPRKDFFQISPEFGWFFYPTNSRLNMHQVDIDLWMLFKPEFGRSDQNLSLSWSGQFQDNGRLRFSLNHRYIYLFDEFDPTRSDDGIPLPAHTDYGDFSLRFSYSGDSRRKFNYRFQGQFGEFFDGLRTSIGGNFSYRIQPYGSIGMNYNLNYVALQDPYPTTTLYLIGPRVDLTFSKHIFFTAVVQYNSQIDNVNVNARFQWRYKPVSDFFLVYTDNYGTDGLGVKNRSLVAKVTYWLNL